MLIYLLRHGQTEYNAQKRYQASATSRSHPKALPSCAGQILTRCVYVSTLQRTSQTARILFPEQSLCRWTA